MVLEVHINMQYNHMGNVNVCLKGLAVWALYGCTKIQIKSGMLSDPLCQMLPRITPQPYQGNVDQELGSDFGYKA